jgi:hypothetical protein
MPLLNRTILLTLDKTGGHNVTDDVRLKLL